MLSLPLPTALGLFSEVALCPLAPRGAWLGRSLPALCQGCLHVEPGMDLEASHFLPAWSCQSRGCGRGEGTRSGGAEGRISPPPTGLPRNRCASSLHGGWLVPPSVPQDESTCACLAAGRCPMGPFLCQARDCLCQHRAMSLLQPPAVFPLGLPSHSLAKPGPLRVSSCSSQEPTGALYGPEPGSGLCPACWHTVLLPHPHCSPSQGAATGTRSRCAQLAQLPAPNGGLQ